MKLLTHNETPLRLEIKHPSGDEDRDKILVQYPEAESPRYQHRMLIPKRYRDDTPTENPFQGILERHRIQWVDLENSQRFSDKNIEFIA